MAFLANRTAACAAFSTISALPPTVSHRMCATATRAIALSSRARRTARNAVLTRARPATVWLRGYCTLPMLRLFVCAATRLKSLTIISIESKLQYCRHWSLTGAPGAECSSSACPNNSETCCSLHSKCNSSNCGTGWTRNSFTGYCAQVQCESNTTECCVQNNSCQASTCTEGFHRNSYNGVCSSLLCETNVGSATVLVSCHFASRPRMFTNLTTIPAQS